MTDRCVTCWGDPDDPWLDRHGFRHDNPATDTRTCCGAAQCDPCLSRFTCAECGE